jgi:hypothetical protein
MKKPVLGARWLIEQGADGTRTHWRIDGDAFGRLVLQPISTADLPLTGAVIVVLDITSHPWRRRLQRPPTTSSVARALVASASDEFPFPPEAMRYAIGFEGDEAWLCAADKAEVAGLAQQPELPEAALSGLSDTPLNNAPQTEASPQAEPLPGRQQAMTLQAVLLAAPGTAGALAGLRHYQRYGAATDFLGLTQWLIYRHWLKLAGRALALFASLALLLGLLVSDRLPSWLLAQEVEQLESESADTRLRHQNVLRMQSAQRALAEVHGSPEAHLPEVLERAFATIPAGHQLSRVDYRNGTLTLGGTGAQGREWLLGLGVPEASIHTESVGNYHHFRAEFNPEQLRQPAAPIQSTGPRP